MTQNAHPGTVTDAVIVEVHDEKATQACRDILAVVAGVDPYERHCWPVEQYFDAIERLAKAGLEETQK